MHAVSTILEVWEVLQPFGILDSPINYAIIILAALNPWSGYTKNEKQDLIPFFFILITRGSTWMVKHPIWFGVQLEMQLTTPQAHVENTFYCIVGCDSSITLKLS